MPACNISFVSELSDLGLRSYFFQPRKQKCPGFIWFTGSFTYPVEHLFYLTRNKDDTTFLAEIKKYIKMEY